MIEEFVTREGSSFAVDGYSLEVKVEQVLEQLKAGKIGVVFDLCISITRRDYNRTAYS
jgi:uncharacterized protein YheU (UPF0270 family)